MSFKAGNFDVAVIGANQTDDFIENDDYATTETFAYC